MSRELLHVESLSDKSNESLEIDSKESLRSVKSLFNRLKRSMGIGTPVPGTEKYTGMHAQLGSSIVENTPISGMQLKFAMAASQHELVRGLKDVNYMDLSPEQATQKFERLVEAKVLKDLKILDLGCGHIPAMARVARQLGAEVWTADRIGSDIFEFDDDFKGDLRKAEIDYHIQLDFNNANATEIIEEKTGGNFDIVTEAHVSTDDFYSTDVLANPLLAHGGMYYGATSDQVTIKT